MGEQNTAVEIVNRLAFELPHMHSVRDILDRVVKEFAAMPGVALAEIWLTAPDDLCLSCSEPDLLDGQLHLVALSTASRRRTIVPRGHARHVNAEHPILGPIMRTGKAFVCRNIETLTNWWQRNGWTRRSQVVGVAAEPLCFREQGLGAIVVYLNERYQRSRLRWLRIISGHTASAIVNARAFAQIEHLRDRLRHENAYLRAAVTEAHAFGKIVGRSPPLKRVLQQISLVAPTDASVLISGESGTGKELIAREIHRNSNRSDEAIITVNCASVPRDLYESEFFGHVKGAFTGASENRVGRFEMANGGTLFLDEVGEIPLSLQSKLLRVLQEGCYERVGEGRTRKADVRVIAASNRDLLAESAAGRFRQDLFYRLNVFPIELPPLRARKQDIPLLARHFLQLATRRLNRPSRTLTKANVLALQSYDWPGNVRELENVIERAVITCSVNELHIDLPAGDVVSKPVPHPVARYTRSSSRQILTEQDLRQLERENLLNALSFTNWKVSGSGGAAELLGIHPSTLASRIKKWNIKRTQEE